MGTSLKSPPARTDRRRPADSDDHAIGHPDDTFMSTALALARRGLGNTAPNPAVGCVIVKNGVIVGRGWTQPGGRPHAETEALTRAGAAAKGATAYVTLEPCCHTGQTPPCTDALIAAGIARVVVATSDPDDRVDGGGIAALEDAGLEVISGLGEAETIAVNAGFFKRTRTGLPYIALKSASSLDGRIALADGTSQWITGAIARRFSHMLRASYDAIVVGSGTVLADNPQLTCRLPGYRGPNPVRVVLDRRLRIDPGAVLVSSACDVPTWIVTSASADNAKCALLEKAGIRILTAADPSDHAFARAAASLLAEQGLNRILIEGGGQIAASFLHDDLIDRVYALRSGMIIGADGRPSMAGLKLTSLDAAPSFRRADVRPLGDDVLEILDRAPTV